MGRKSQSKQTAKKNAGKEINKYELQKRKNLTVLVDRLLKLTSIFQPSLTSSKLWEHHLEIESIIKQIRALERPKTKLESTCREKKFQQFLKWLDENRAEYEGVEICEYEGMNFGLKATKPFQEGSLILNVPKKLMMTETDAKESSLGEFIATDPVLQNMPNITLALFLLFEKNKTDSFWKPYIDILPDTYTTVLYFTSEELAELKPSPILDSSLKLIRSISRQYAYFWSNIHSMGRPELKDLQDIFTFDNYRWAVSTVMTRQNNIKLENTEVTAFIPLWDMCNHEQGMITTNFNDEKGVCECFAQRDFGKNDQIFIYYGVRPNADLFLHNGFVYRDNKDDKLPLVLGISSSDVLRDLRLLILQKLGLGNVALFTLYRLDNPLPPALLAFIRVFTMNEEELIQWSSESMPSDLLSSDPSSSELVGPEIDRKAYKYLLTRCNLLKLSYKNKEDSPSDTQPKNIHLENIKALKESEVQILDGAISYLQCMIDKLPATTNGDQLPAKLNCDKIPTEINGDKLPANTNCHKLPAEIKCDELPVETNCNKLPAEIKCDELPAETNCNKLPVETNCNKLPAEIKCDELPVETNCNKLPVETNCNKLPAEIKCDELPVETNCNKLPAEIKCDELPAETNCNKLPVETNCNKLPAEIKCDELPVETNCNKLPVETNCNKLPAEIKCDELPVETNCNKLPVETNCNKLPAEIKCDELPVETNCNKLPVETNCNKLPAEIK